jgi:hypothetical protein
LLLTAASCTYCTHEHAMESLSLMLYVLMIHIVMDIFEITFFMINYLLYVIIVMLIYEIKMIWKMPIILAHEGILSIGRH